MSKHLIIPDSHAMPGTDLSRFEWAGKFAADIKPDTIINMGDWFDMPSLCSYDRGTRVFEGRRYISDINAGNQALSFFNSGFNDAAIYTKRAKPKARKVALEGNHEHRIHRATQLSPELDGTLSLQAMMWGLYKWEWVPYEGSTPGVINIDGINYSHYFISGIMGRPIGGEYPAATLLKKCFASCVIGHNHLRDFAERVDANGKKILGLSSGCYTSDTHDYAGMANNMWWRGLVVLHDVHDGVYDPEFISLDRLERMYG